MTARHHRASTAQAASPHASAVQNRTTLDASDASMPDSADLRMQRLRELAYGFFVERGCADGHALDDWLLAESKLAGLNGSAGAPVFDGSP